MKIKHIFALDNLKITKKFNEKLKQNFSALTYLEMLVYFLFIRPFWSKEKRFFFEGCKRLLGQMYVAERKKMYDTILRYKPRQCFEIGTYTGGGSTFFISKALYKNNKGKLISMENDSFYYNKAANFYKNKLPNLKKHVEFVHGDSFKYFERHILDNKIECFFLDGAEDGRQTLEQYNSFLPYCKKGTIMMVHDWNTEKTIKIKPIINNDLNWKKNVELVPPSSVGFVVFERI